MYCLDPTAVVVLQIEPTEIVKASWLAVLVSVYTDSSQWLIDVHLLNPLGTVRVTMS